MEAELINNVEGLEGELGYKGERGYSAYEIAVKNGFEGTEQDWLDHFGVDLTGYIKTSDVKDNLTSTDTTYPLSAKQGKILNEGKIDRTDIVDDCETEDATKVLSAKQGKRLMDWATMLYRDKADEEVVVYNDNFAFVETGRSRFSEDGSNNVHIPYPSGFNRYNTAIISMMDETYADTTTSFAFAITPLAIYWDTNHYSASISLGDDFIDVWVYNSVSGGLYRNIKLALVKRF